MSRDGHLPDGCTHADVDAAAPPDDQPEPTPPPWDEVHDRFRRLAEDYISRLPVAERDGWQAEQRAISSYMVGSMAMEIVRLERQVERLRERLAEVPAHDTNPEAPF